MKTFDPEKHVYKSDYTRLPGATDVIKSQSLINTNWMSEEVRWRGKCVHRGIELFVKEELDWNTVDEVSRPYLRSFERFLNVTGFQVVGAEEACFDEAFACMPDLWGMLNKEKVIIELKTGGVPKWAAIQTALQRRALVKHCGFFATKRFGLRLMSDGSLSKLIPFENPRDERSAMSMVDALWYKKENGYWDWEK